MIKEIMPGVELIPISLDCAEDLHRLVDRNREHLRPWMPWEKSTTDVSVTIEFLKRACPRMELHKELQTLIYVDAEIAGIIGFHEIEPDSHKISLGYWLGQEFTGRGIVTEATRFYTTYAFNELGMDAVEIHCNPDNKASRGIPERLNYQIIDIREPGQNKRHPDESMVIYEMLKENWYL